MSAAQILLEHLLVIVIVIMVDRGNEFNQKLNVIFFIILI